MKPSIANHIEKKTGLEGLLEQLSKKLSASELQSLLMEVFHQRASDLSPGELLRQYQNNPFVQPSALPVDKLLSFEKMAQGLLPEAFQVLLLSPVSPLGSCTAIAPLHQNNVVSTIRPPRSGFR